jgi:hypothetical protein
MVRYAVLFEFVVKRPSTDSELLGGLFLVPSSGGESHQDEFFFDRAKRHPRMNRKVLCYGILCGACGSNSQREKIRRQLFSLGHQMPMSCGADPAPAADFGDSRFVRSPSTGLRASPEFDEGTNGGKLILLMIFRSC